MSNPSFDIDDILNEINKKREEIEREINSVTIDSLVAESEITQSAKTPEKTEEVETEKPVITEEAPEPEETEITDEPEISEETEPEAVEEAVEEPVDNQEENEAPADDIEELFDTADESEGTDNSEPAEENVDEDYDALIKRRKEKSEKKRNKKKKRKILISVIIILVVAIIGSLGFGYFYIDKIMDNITVDPVETPEDSNTEEWNGMDELVLNFTPIYEDAGVSSYRDFSKNWYYNGEPASSSHVLNIMLIGEDTRGDEIMDAGTLADSVIIASVNIDSGELILSSILRDTYAYYELVPGDETTGTYGKINEAMSKGNLSTYINAVERLYKVNIDNYVLVNFSNFKQIIDTLGGVTIEMTAAEIREINNHPKRYGNVYIEGDAGEKQLNGEQALAYSRIRYIDSDINRSERQRTVLLDVFRQLKSASITRLTRVATNLLPYVKTGFTKGEILTIGSYGFSHGWLNYTIVTHTVPLNETKADGTVLNVWTDDKSYGYSTLKVDFPLASQVLQEKIYGTTNVNLSENRPNFRYLSAY